MRAEPEYVQAMLAAADAAERRPAWAEYAHYCRNRERGLRRQALASLNQFISGAESWPFDQRREFAAWLSSLLETPGWERYDLTPYPLVTRLLIPTLHQWLELDPTTPLPHRWLGMFFSNHAYHVVVAGLGPMPQNAAEYLRRALELDANEQPARVRLARLLIGWLNYDAHHLPDFYIGDPADDVATVQEAARLIEGISASSVREQMSAELQLIRQRLDDWIAFCSERGTDFAEWCRLRGRAYRWCRAYYYEP
jgi:hypothetical protein